MISIETLLSFLMASFLIALAPGPDNIFVLAQSAMRGKNAGLTVTLGLCTGLIAHSFLVAFGVAVIFRTSSTAFTVLKFIGAGYLVYLAWRAFCASAWTIKAREHKESGLRGLYYRGIIMNITNPKVSVFFLAFLPQFAEPGIWPVWAQILMLGGVFIGVTIVVFGSIALLAGTLGDRFNRSGMAQKVLNRIAGSVFLVLALKLAMTQR